MALSACYHVPHPGNGYLDPHAEIILYVGRFAPLKGLDRLVKAVARIQNQLPDIRLVVVGGDGPDAESFLRTPIKMKILVQDQGGGEVQAAGIL